MSISGKRFKDVELGNKRLPACYGYLTSKTVTLGEAMEQFRSTVPEVDQFVKLAKKHCTYPNDDKLTKDEAAAIYLYTMEMSGDECVYRILNQTLRADDRSLVKPWFSYLKIFNTAASKLPKFKGIIWRGIDKNISQSFKRGQKITWWSISSCSKSIDVIKTFLGKASKCTLFNIECLTGKLISDYTCYPSEDEIILMPGTTFEVVANPLEHTGGLSIVHLKEIPDDDNEDEPQEKIATASASASATTSVTKIFDKMTIENPAPILTKPSKKTCDEGFDPSGKVDKYCKGRLCKNCGKCRDWYYTDRATWKWIRNAPNWKNNDWQRWDNGDYDKNFQRRDGYSCTGSGSFFFHHYYSFCLCKDNLKC